MSKMNKIHNIKFDPENGLSHGAIMRSLALAIAAGHKAIDLQWQDQKIELDFNERAKQWRGLGSINQESGHTIARDLNGIHDFITGHFAIYHARG